MKKLFSIVAAVLITAGVFAQSPEKMSYQAVIRNNSNALVTNTSVGMKISILQGSASGTEVYVETQTPTTNVNGLVSIEIGSGTVVSGTFSSIDWSNDTYYIKTETDPTGGTSYSITGTSQLLSVPYALYAKTAGTVGSHYVGELYGGGVVFWVDHTGKKGLIISMVDLSTSQGWSNVTGDNTRNTNDWDGMGNTAAIIGQSGHTSSAAKLCNDYTNTDYGTGTYSDWYLPSIAELFLIRNNFYAVQKALDSDGNNATNQLDKSINYWSSTESTSSYALSFKLSDGSTIEESKLNNDYVRAIRAF